MYTDVCKCSLCISVAPPCELVETGAFIYGTMCHVPHAPSILIGGSGSPFNTVFLGPPSFIPNRTSLRTAVFAGRRSMIDRQADIPRYGIVSRNRPHLMKKTKHVTVSLMVPRCANCCNMKENEERRQSRASCTELLAGRSGFLAALTAFESRVVTDDSD